MTPALAWLKEHKAMVALAGLLVAVFVAGRASVSQPAVHAVEQEHAKADVNSRVDTTVHAGPWTVKTWDYACPSVDHVSAPVVGTGAADAGLRVQVAQHRVPAASAADRAGEEGQQDSEHDGNLLPGPLIRYTEETHGATATETHAKAEQHQELDRKLDLTVAPSAMARSIALGAEDPFGARKLHLEAGVMVTDHVGVRVGWTPANGLLAGLTPMAEFRF